MQNKVIKTILFFMFWVNFTHAQISVSLPDTVVEATSSITIPIYVSDVSKTGIYSYQFRLIYDQDVLKPKSIIDDGTISDKRSWNLNAYLDSEGLVIRASGWPSLSGSGVLLYVKFDVLTSSGYSDLTLDPFVFNNGTPKTKINNGSFKVFVNQLIKFYAAGNGSGKISINNKEYSLPLEIKLQKNESYILKALPNSNSSFDNWSGDLNSNNNPVSYKITNNADITLNFSIKSYSISVILKPEDYGFIEGVGIYNYGDQAILKANPYSGKTFVSWELNGKIVSDNPEYKITVKADLEFTANFDNAILQITANASPVEGGIITGAGYYFPNDTVTVATNSNSNWNFVNWTEDGEIVSQDSVYTFIVTEDRELLANYLVTDIELNSGNIIENSFLSDPYPNPFNPSTTFEFALKSNSKVSLVILDITGKVVMKIYDNEYISKGIYQNVFNASNLSSGVYFFRFEAVDNEANKLLHKSGKIVLVK